MSDRTLLPATTTLALLIAACAAQAAPATVAGADRIVSRTLPNGLEVVVWPDHDIPNDQDLTPTSHLRAPSGFTSGILEGSKSRGEPLPLSPRPLPAIGGFPAP